MNIPSELKYTRDHEWIRTEGAEAFVGITDFAQRELGDIVYIDITAGDSEIFKDETFGSVEAVKTVSDLFMPVTGTILEVNSALEAQPELVNTDPYGEGWMLRISVADASQLDGLLTAEEYKKLTGI